MEDRNTTKKNEVTINKSIIVALEWFVLRLVIMETTRTGGNVTSGVCVCVCVCYLHAAVACGDSFHVSAVYWNIAGTCLCPEVFNGYLRASAGSLWVPFSLTKVLYKS